MKCNEMLTLYGAFLRFESGALDLISELKRDFYTLYCCSLYGLVVVWENFLIRISIIAEITIDFWLLSVDIAQNFGCKSSFFNLFLLEIACGKVCTLAQ